MLKGQFSPNLFSLFLLYPPRRFWCELQSLMKFDERFESKAKIINLLMVLEAKSEDRQDRKSVV